MSSTTLTETVAVMALPLGTVNMTPVKDSHDFETTIGYTRGLADGSEPSMDDLAADKPGSTDVRRVKVHDIRGMAKSPTLDVNGFQAFMMNKIPGEDLIDWNNEKDPNIRSVYYQGLGEWFAGVIGATKVICFDHTVRQEHYAAQESYRVRTRGPARRPHIDITHEYAPEMFQDVFSRMGPLGEEVLANTKHWKEINLWRPIRTVRRDPFALVDTKSVPREHLVSTHFDRGDGATVSSDWLLSGLKSDQPDADNNHKWCYLHEQQPNEVLAFKNYDSDPQAESNGTPHGAVHVPGTENETFRHSIECRTFALWY